MKVVHDFINTVKKKKTKQTQNSDHVDVTDEMWRPLPLCQVQDYWLVLYFS